MKTSQNHIRAWGLSALVLLATVAGIFVVDCHAEDRIPSAEAAFDRFRAACDHEIKQAVSPETMDRINSLRKAPALMIIRKAPEDLAGLKDQKALADASRFVLYGSYDAVARASSRMWIFGYDAMKGLAVYIDAPSGTVLCVAFIPEG